jgi:hypothetical protein
MGTLHEDTCIYENISLNSSENENISDKSCKGNQNTSLLLNNSFCENSSV